MVYAFGMLRKPLPARRLNHYSFFFSFLTSEGLLVIAALWLPNLFPLRLVLSSSYVCFLIILSPQNSNFRLMLRCYSYSRRNTLPSLPDLANRPNARILCIPQKGPKNPVSLRTPLAQTAHPSSSSSSSKWMPHNLAFNYFPLFHVSSLLPEINYQLRKSKSHIITSSVFSNGPHAGLTSGRPSRTRTRIDWYTLYHILRFQVPNPFLITTKHDTNEHSTGLKGIIIQCCTNTENTLFPRMSSDNHMQRYGKDACFFVKLMLGWEFTCE